MITNPKLIQAEPCSSGGARASGCSGSGGGGRRTVRSYFEQRVEALARLRAGYPPRRHVVLGSVPGARSPQGPASDKHKLTIDDDSSRDGFTSPEARKHWTLPLGSQQQKSMARRQRINIGGCTRAKTLESAQTLLPPRGRNATERVLPPRRCKLHQCTCMIDSTASRASMPLSMAIHAGRRDKWTSMCQMDAPTNPVVSDIARQFFWWRLVAPLLHMAELGRSTSFCRPDTRTSTP
jgi:hypothetical protein